ncbi:MAG TPA: hypothetical protein VD994_04125 [Prosthecobacter sp.]|nr:hypothetical protein [Prosthecobacter sp.]
MGYLHHERITKADILKQRRAEMLKAGHQRGRLVSWNFHGITAQDVEIARAEAISYAAYRLLKSRYAKSVNRSVTSMALDQRMRWLGYRPENTGTIGKPPAAVGNRIAASVMAWGLEDNSNEAGGYTDPKYANSQTL